MAERRRETGEGTRHGGRGRGGSWGRGVLAGQQALPVGPGQHGAVEVQVQGPLLPRHPHRPGERGGTDRDRERGGGRERKREREKERARAREREREREIERDREKRASE